MESNAILTVKNKYRNDYRNGHPLITTDSVSNSSVLKAEGSLIKLVDESGEYLGTGYYGKQNKGIGWVVTRNEEETIDSAFFERKIADAIARRSKFYEDPDTTAFRVFNGEGDGLGGLTIEYFAGYYLVTWYSLGIFKFNKEIILALEKTVPFKAVYQKKRFAETGKYIEEDDFVMGERGQFPITVKENGVNFAVYLNDGAMVGVFLDQRDVRKAIRDKYAAGKTVLNMFSYTGAFSVFAALGGALKTTSVDLANRSRSKTMEQFSINDINPEEQDIIVEDVFNYFKYAVRRKLSFGMVILDPPSFARSKKMTFSAAKDYKNLLKEAIAITEQDGIIVASTNSNAFGMRKFKGFIDTAFKEMGGKYDILEEFSLPEDFRISDTFKEGNYLKVVFIRKVK